VTAEPFGRISPVVVADGTEADLVAAAVSACPLVADLHPGVYGEVGTHLPGRRVPGIRLDTTTVEVHVTGYPAPTMEAIAAQIRRAVGPYAAGRAVDVVIEDLLLPGERPVPVPAADPAPAAPEPAPPVAAAPPPPDPRPEVVDVPDGSPVVVAAGPAPVVVTVAFGGSDRPGSVVVRVTPEPAVADPPDALSEEDGPGRPRFEYEEPLS